MGSLLRVERRRWSYSLDLKSGMLDSRLVITFLMHGAAAITTYSEEALAISLFDQSKETMPCVEMVDRRPDTHQQYRAHHRQDRSLWWLAGDRP